MLSLSMIVRDEAERSPACLNVGAGFVDEQVVVDTAPRCDSRDQPRQHVAPTVSHHPWPGDFAPAAQLGPGLVKRRLGAGARCREQLFCEALEPFATVDGPSLTCC